MNNKKLGIQGEYFAKQYLENNKYKILATNYSCAIGEIDIVAKQNDTYIFVEVKSRTSNIFGQPSEAVGKYKQQKIRQVATCYLKQHRLYDKVQIRFDVIEYLSGNINHIENAF